MKRLLNALPAAAFATTAAFAAVERPNIILIVADDLGWGDLSCYPQDPAWGDEVRVSTPNLDKLAKAGVRFTQAYATAMVCAPSRAGLLTGVHQQRFGYYGFEDTLAPLPRARKLLPEILREVGYRTGMVGKWHVSSAAGSRPLDRGFERFFGFGGGQHDYYQVNVGETMHGVGRGADAFVYDQDRPVSEMQYLTDEFTERALEFIARPDERPFFLYLAYNAPHPPMQAPWSYLEKYARERPKGKFTPRDIARAMIENLDDNIGRLCDWLSERGLRENTLIVFTSDNGGSDGGPGRMLQHNGGLKGRKGTYYEGGIRVPFLFSWPAGIAGESIYAEMISHLDLYPTLLAAARGSSEGVSLDGVDLLPLLRGEIQEPPRTRLYWCVQNTVAWAVRDGDWKLVREDDDPTTLGGPFRGKGPRSYRLQLYHVASDPRETNDLHDAEPAVVARLTALMDEFRAQTQPSLATPEIVKEWKATLARRAQAPALNDARSLSGSPGHWRGGEKR